MNDREKSQAIVWSLLKPSTKSKILETYNQLTDTEDIVHFQNVFGFNNLVAGIRYMSLREYIIDAYKGEVFFCYLNGPVEYIGINDNGDVEFKRVKDGAEVTYTDGENTIWASGMASLYPSEDYFTKYPLNPIKAWDEWRKLKERVER